MIVTLIAAAVGIAVPHALLDRSIGGSNEVSLLQESPDPGPTPEPDPGPDTGPTPEPDGDSGPDTGPTPEPERDAKL